MKKILVWGNVDNTITLYAGGKKAFKGDRDGASEFFVANYSDLEQSFGATKNAAVPAPLSVILPSPVKAKKVRKAKGALLTPESANLFLGLVRDAGNWSGTPLLDVDSQSRGNLTDLKRKKLVTTQQDEDNRRCVWVHFTEAGRALASELDPTNAQYLS